MGKWELMQSPWAPHFTPCRICNLAHALDGIPRPPRSVLRTLVRLPASFLKGLHDLYCPDRQELP